MLSTKEFLSLHLGELFKFCLIVTAGNKLLLIYTVLVVRTRASYLLLYSYIVLSFRLLHSPSNENDIFKGFLQ